MSLSDARFHPIPEQIFGSLRLMRSQFENGWLLDELSKLLQTLLVRGYEAMIHLNNGVINYKKTDQVDLHYQCSIGAFRPYYW